MTIADPMSTAARLKRAVPWQAKIAAKLVLSRLPIGYRSWRRMGLFAHGDMVDVGYARSVFSRHFERVQFTGKEGGYACLELGPGDSLLSALVARLHGAACTYLVDSGEFASLDVEVYRRAARELTRGRPSVVDAEWRSVDDILAECNARYLTSGLESLATLPSNGVDFCWSQAVLEHVRRSEFEETIAQLRRVLSPGGVCSHQIDLADHLGGSLNNLRFSEKVWESRIFAQAGFYTNRIRYEEMTRIFAKCGFRVEEVEVERWSRVPTPRHKLARPFRAMRDEDLTVRSFHVVLRVA